jgi:hypothetical protein
LKHDVESVKEQNNVRAAPPSQWENHHEKMEQKEQWKKDQHGNTIRFAFKVSCPNLRFPKC